MNTLTNTIQFAGRTFFSGQTPGVWVHDPFTLIVSEDGGKFYFSLHTERCTVTGPKRLTMEEALSALQTTGTTTFR